MCHSLLDLQVFGSWLIWLATLPVSAGRQEPFYFLPEGPLHLHYNQSKKQTSLRISDSNLGDLPSLIWSPASEGFVICWLVGIDTMDNDAPPLSKELLVLLRVQQTPQAVAVHPNHRQIPGSAVLSGQLGSQRVWVWVEKYSGPGWTPH